MNDRLNCLSQKKRKKEKKLGDLKCYLKPVSQIKVLKKDMLSYHSRQLSWC